MMLSEIPLLVLVSWVAYRIENLSVRVKSLEEKTGLTPKGEELSAGKEYLELKPVYHGKREKYQVKRAEDTRIG